MLTMEMLNGHHPFHQRNHNPRTQNINKRIEQHEIQNRGPIHLAFSSADK